MFCYVLIVLSAWQSPPASPRDTYLNRSAASWAQDLSHNDARVRRAAAFALGKLGKHSGPFVAQIKTQLTVDMDPSVRAALAHTLGELATFSAADSIGTLISVLEKEKDLAVRRALALAIGKCGDRAAPAFPLLRKALDDADDRLREHAAWALGQIGPSAEPAIPRLMSLLSDADPGVRAEAVQTLGNLGPLAQEAIPGLIRAVSDAAPKVQEYAVLALRKMGPLAATAIGSLLSIAESTKVETAQRQAALITLETIWPTGLKEPPSWARLQALAKSASDQAVKTTAQQVEKKIAALRN